MNLTWIQTWRTHAFNLCHYAIRGNIHLEYSSLPKLGSQGRGSTVNFKNVYLYRHLKICLISSFQRMWTKMGLTVEPASRLQTSPLAFGQRTQIACGCWPGEKIITDFSFALSPDLQFNGCWADGTSIEDASYSGQTPHFKPLPNDHLWHLWRVTPFKRSI